MTDQNQHRLLVDDLCKQLGKCVIEFQGIEAAMEELVTVMAGGDDYVLLTLTSKMEFSALIDAADVIFARFVDIGRFPETEKEKAEAKEKFHALRNRCLKLAEIRNDIVHSSYAALIMADGEAALLRDNTRPKFKGGPRLEFELETMMEADFRRHIEEFHIARQDIEIFRRVIVGWKHP